MTKGADEWQRRQRILLDLENEVQEVVSGAKNPWSVQWAVRRCAELRNLGDDARPYLSWKQQPDGSCEYKLGITVNGFVEFEEDVKKYSKEGMRK